MIIGEFLNKYGLIYYLDPSGPSENKCQPGREPFLHSTRGRLCESEVKDDIALFVIFSPSLYLF